MDSPQPPVIVTPARRRLMIYRKLGCICLLLLLLQIPLFMTGGVLRERQRYQLQATEEIAGIWGRRQRVTGPVLAVPYAYRATVIRSWRALLNWSVRRSIISDAFRVALSMAVIRAPYSAARDSIKAW